MATERRGMNEQLNKLRPKKVTPPLLQDEADTEFGVMPGEAIEDLEKLVKEIKD